MFTLFVVPKADTVNHKHCIYYSSYFDHKKSFLVRYVNWLCLVVQIEERIWSDDPQLNGTYARDDLVKTSRQNKGDHLLRSSPSLQTASERRGYQSKCYSITSINGRRTGMDTNSSHLLWSHGRGRSTVLGHVASFALAIDASCQQRVERFWNVSPSSPLALWRAVSIYTLVAACGNRVLIHLFEEFLVISFCRLTDSLTQCISYNTLLLLKLLKILQINGLKIIMSRNLENHY